MPAKGAGMGKAGGAMALGGGGACGYLRGGTAPSTGDSVGKALTYSKHNGHASKGQRAPFEGQPTLHLWVQN